MAEFKAGPRRRKPTHPGAILKRDLEALEVSIYAAAIAIGVTRAALNNIISEKSAVSPEMALRLERYVGGSAEHLLGMQADHDLWMARQKSGAKIAAIKPAARRDG